jgi:hypothetical protein
VKKSATFRICALALLAFAMASFLLFHFASIWAYGNFYIFETNRLVLILETTGMVAILGFSVFCIAEQLRKTR